MFAQHSTFGIKLEIDKKFLNYAYKSAETVASGSAESGAASEAEMRAAEVAAAVKEQAKARRAAEAKAKAKAMAKAKAKAKAKASEKEERRLLAEAARAAKMAEVETVVKEVKKPQDVAAKAAEEAAKAGAIRSGAQAKLVQVRARPCHALVARCPLFTRHACSTLSPRPPPFTQVQVELKKGQTIMVDVDVQMPAAILHEVVSNRSGMPSEGFALYYQSKKLEGEAALSSWGVEKDATIEVKTRGRGGVQTHGPGMGSNPSTSPTPTPSLGPSPRPTALLNTLDRWAPHTPSSNDRESLMSHPISLLTKACRKLPVAVRSRTRIPLCFTRLTKKARIAMARYRYWRNGGRIACTGSTATT